MYMLRAYSRLHFFSLNGNMIPTRRKSFKGRYTVSLHLAAQDLGGGSGTLGPISADFRSEKRQNLKNLLDILTFTLLNTILCKPQRI